MAIEQSQRYRAALGSLDATCMWCGTPLILLYSLPACFKAAAVLWDRALLEKALFSMKLLAVGVFLRCLPPLLATLFVLAPPVALLKCWTEAAAVVAASTAAMVAWDCNHAAP